MCNSYFDPFYTKTQKNLKISDMYETDELDSRQAIHLHGSIGYIQCKYFALYNAVTDTYTIET